MVFSVSDPDKRLQALWVVCDKLPKNNKTNLRWVSRKATTPVFLVHAREWPRVCAGIWWSFCPNWLKTAKWTRWPRVTSPSCSDLICCGPRLTGERGSDVVSYWCKNRAGCSVNCHCPPRSLAEMAAATSVHVVAIVEPIIQHADWFFPEGKLWVSLTSLPVRPSRFQCECTYKLGYYGNLNAPHQSHRSFMSVCQTLFETESSHFAQ